MARASFEAFKAGDTAKFAALFHPAETDRFKKFAGDVFQVEMPDAEVEQIRKLFAPYDSSAAIAAASGNELLATFVGNSIKSIEGFKELVAGTKLQILGEVAESQKVHVITRALLPRPQPVSCRQHEGRWYQLLNDETMRVVGAFERKQHFREKSLTPGQIQQQASLAKVDVIGHVPDGATTAQVLCRVQMKIDDFQFPIFACYPVRKGEPAWDHLSDKDPAKLSEALQAKWKR